MTGPTTGDGGPTWDDLANGLKSWTTVRVAVLAVAAAALWFYFVLEPRDRAALGLQLTYLLGKYAVIPLVAGVIVGWVMWSWKAALWTLAATFVLAIAIFATRS